MGIAETRISQLQDRVVGLSVPASAWNAENRAAAVERLQSMGLPAPRDEYWRFTDPKSLNAIEAPKAACLIPKKPMCLTQLIVWKSYLWTVCLMQWPQTI